MSELHAVAHKMVEKGKGILAADESTPTALNALKVLIQIQRQKAEIFTEICFLQLKILKNT